MQKSFVAIALALTLSCALAAYTANNYVKAPVDAVANTDYNFTNMTYGSLAMASITIGDVYLVSQNMTTNTGNSSANNWAIWYKKLDAKTLTAGSNASATFTAPAFTLYYNNYAFSLNGDNSTNTPQLYVYQTPLNGGAALARVQLTTNTNQTFTPSMASMGLIGKTIYVFFLASEQKVNFTSIQIGATTVGTQYTLTTAYDTPASLQIVWGEALSTSQLFAIWIENGALKESVVDVSKGTVTPTAVGAYDKTYSCSAYATDKKYYGEFCTKVGENGTVQYYIRTNTTSLAPLGNQTFTNTSTVVDTFAYGPYLALVYQDSVTAAPSKSYAYEIWNLDTLTTFKARTQFLTIDDKSSWSFFRVSQGGLYTLIYNNRQQLNETLTSVQVGLLLGSSYLASVFGFLLTIIAGLFLF